MIVECPCGKQHDVRNLTKRSSKRVCECGRIIDWKRDNGSALTWMCRACKEFRPDAWISVAKRRIVADVPALPVDLTACYCNDRPRCFLEMPRILDAMARPIIDGLIAPRVHILWQGLTICDPHKRWPEDFPGGAKAFSLAHSFDSAGFAGVSCELCRQRVAHRRLERGGSTTTQ
jgi:hypothetical protein